jgi:4-amino-4-deoxy-L-arabinose transferase-like glycosyltransferase
MEQGRPSSRPVAIAAIFFLSVWSTAAFHGYGWFVDELYYLACARHPALGYVDHPPLSVLLLVPVRMLFGEVLWAVRLPAALAGAASVLFAARTAWRMGGGAFAQTLAAVVMATAPATLLLAGFHSMNVFELAFGAALGELLARLLVTDRPRLWVGFGAIVGAALMNKHTFVVVAGSLAIATLFTDARRHFGTRWPWLGLGVAALILLPNVLWQATHHWISLEFYRQATRIKNVPTSPLGVLVGQLEIQGVVGMAATLVATLWLVRQPRLRAFAIALGSLMLSGLSRSDRIMGLYPAMFAASGV